MRTFVSGSDFSLPDDEGHLASVKRQAQSDNLLRLVVHRLPVSQRGTHSVSEGVLGTRVA